LQQVDLCLDHVGPTHWEKKQETSKEKVIGRVQERDWIAVDENSEGQAGMERTGRNYEHYFASDGAPRTNSYGGQKNYSFGASPIDGDAFARGGGVNSHDASRTHRHDTTVHDVIRLLIPALYKNQSDSLMAADGDWHHLCKLMEPVRHRWSISDVIVEIRNTVMPSDCSALRFGIRSLGGVAAVIRRPERASLNASYEVYEEVGCVSSDDSTRRADIIIIDQQKDKGVILDPTIRFEMHEQQPQEVLRTSAYPGPMLVFHLHVTNQ
ncbi:hypothetical protein ANN_14577, partial [Periplaneta americana]